MSAIKYYLIHLLEKPSVAVFLCITLAYLSYKYYYRRYFYLGEKINGPNSYPIFGNVLSFFEKKNESYYNTKVAKTVKHSNNMNDIFRIWIFHILFVVITDPVHAQDILKNTVLPKSKYYKTLFGNTALGQGVLTQINQDEWKRQRKVITPVFHFKILYSYIGNFYEESVTLCNKVREDIKNGRDQIPIDNKLKMAGCEMIIRNILGIRVYAQDNDQHPFIINMSKQLEIAQRRIYQPWLLSEFLFKLLGLHVQQKKAKNEVYEFMRKVIETKRKELNEQTNNKNIKNENLEEIKEEDEIEEIDVYNNKNKSKSILEILLEMGNTSNEKFTDEELLPEMTTLFFAAFDTTSTGNSSTLLLLAMHQEILKKVHDEIDLIFGGPGIDDGHQPSVAELNQLEYLECVIKEAMRLFPPGPVTFREVSEEVQCGKYTLPIGTIVAVSFAAIHRHPCYYQFPFRFIPERFSPDKIKERHPYAYLPFSAGLRNCVGQKYAMLQMKTVLSTILRNFTLFPSEKFLKIKNIEKIITMDMTLTIKSGVVGFKSRT